MILTYDQIKNLCYGLNGLRKIKFKPKAAYKIALNCNLLNDFWKKINEEEIKIKLKYKDIVNEGMETDAKKYEQCKKELDNFYNQTVDINAQLIPISDFPDDILIECVTMFQLFPIISNE